MKRILILASLLLVPTGTQAQTALVMTSGVFEDGKLNCDKSQNATITIESSEGPIVLFPCEKRNKKETIKATITHRWAGELRGTTEGEPQCWWTGTGNSLEKQCNNSLVVGSNYASVGYFWSGWKVKETYSIDYCIEHGEIRVIKNVNEKITVIGEPSKPH